MGAYSIILSGGEIFKDLGVKRKTKNNLEGTTILSAAQKYTALGSISPYRLSLPGTSQFVPIIPSVYPLQL